MKLAWDKWYNTVHVAVQLSLHCTLKTGSEPSGRDFIGGEKKLYRCISLTGGSLYLLFLYLTYTIHTHTVLVGDRRIHWQTNIVLLIDCMLSH